MAAMRKSIEAHLQELRGEIVSVQDQLDLCTDGQLPKSEWAQRVRAWIESQAQAFQDEGMLSISGARSPRGPVPGMGALIMFGSLTVRGSSAPSGPIDSGVPRQVSVAEADAGPLLCWLFGDLLEKRFAEVIEQTSYREGPPASKRSALRSKLQAELNQLGRSEESLIVHAEQLGLDLPRRPDADPSIILSLDLPTFEDLNDAA